ncbi:unnamed protein product [Gadus morhua 'NCC']
MCGPRTPSALGPQYCNTNGLDPGAEEQLTVCSGGCRLYSDVSSFPWTPQRGGSRRHSLDPSAWRAKEASTGPLSVEAPGGIPWTPQRGGPRRRPLDPSAWRTQEAPQGPLSVEGPGGVPWTP